jgi:hypothetical protein
MCGLSLPSMSVVVEYIEQKALHDTNKDGHGVPAGEGGAVFATMVVCLDLSTRTKRVSSQCYTHYLGMFDRKGGSRDM